MSGLKKKERSKLTQERVKELFDYCEDTGVLIRKIRHTGCVNIGDRVGRDLTEAVAHRLAAEQCLGWEGCDCNSPAYLYMRKYLKGEL